MHQIIFNICYPADNLKCAKRKFEVSNASLMSDFNLDSTFSAAFAHAASVFGSQSTEIYSETIRTLGTANQL